MVTGGGSETPDCFHHNFVSHVSHIMDAELWDSVRSISLLCCHRAAAAPNMPNTRTQMQLIGMDCIN